VSVGSFNISSIQNTFSLLRMIFLKPFHTEISFATIVIYAHSHPMLGALIMVTRLTV
jgi:hypothetical protein